ncbi:MAG TPA: haloacid dehalogenase [Methanocella sp.]|uniref:haloacid dehalogenase n=1 Tax=Methanocella sp. TaxID=2052833 RepID=UPI002B936865|nr:haloacid dehalogenase [Methanocella sp.]HTY89742.1 haloacid dehalogenase [Methanocella sp.]
MESLKDISARVRARFDAMDKAREGALAASRKITRNSGDSIKAIHRGEWAEAERLIRETRSLSDQLHDALKDFPEAYYSGYVEDAQVEFAEVSILYSVLRGLDLPTPESLRIENTAYLKGMGDASGELRRHILDLIRKGRPEEGEKYLDIMDEFYTEMMSFDYPDAIMHGLRKKTDVARSLIERTRGDLTNALEIKGLHESMERFDQRLK